MPARKWRTRLGSETNPSVRRYYGPSEHVKVWRAVNRFKASGAGLREFIRIWAEETGADLDTVLAPTRSGVWPSWFRFCLINTARSLFPKMSYPHFAKIIGRDHSTIFHNLGLNRVKPMALSAPHKIKPPKAPERRKISI